MGHKIYLATFGSKLGIYDHLGGAPRHVPLMDCLVRHFTQSSVQICSVSPGDVLLLCHVSRTLGRIAASVT